MITKARRLLARPWPELHRRVTELGPEKQCPGCGEWLPHDQEFYGYTKSRNSYRSHCRACEAEQTAKRRSASERKPLDAA